MALGVVYEDGKLQIKEVVEEQTAENLNKGESDNED